MKRDMEVIRKVLLVIEDQYIDTVLYNVEVDEYDMKMIAYHCNLLYEAGLISKYGGNYAGGELQDFGVGSLTWEGHNFLDKIRDNTIWSKTKGVIKEKGIPLAFDTVKQVATLIIETMIQSAIS